MEVVNYSLSAGIRSTLAPEDILWRSGHRENPLSENKGHGTTLLPGLLQTKKYNAQ